MNARDAGRSHDRNRDLRRPAPVVTLRRTFSTAAVNDPHRASTSHRFRPCDLPQRASPYFSYNQAQPGCMPAAPASIGCIPTQHWINAAAREAAKGKITMALTNSGGALKAETTHYHQKTTRGFTGRQVSFPAGPTERLAGIHCISSRNNFSFPLTMQKSWGNPDKKPKEP